MGIVNSVSMAFCEDDPKAKLWRDGEKIEDSNESKEEEENEDSNETEDSEESVDSEEIEECGYCTYIKRGVCKESFIAMDKCNEEEGKPTKCMEARKIFQTCMFANPVYYEPIIKLEAKMIARMISELQAEKEAVLAGDAVAIAKALSKLQTEEETVLPAEVAAIAKAFQDLEADKEKEIAKGNESDHQKTP